MPVDSTRRWFDERQSLNWMAAPPRLTKLGAKWVEVRSGGQRLPEMA